MSFDTRYHDIDLRRNEIRNIQRELRECRDYSPHNLEWIRQRKERIADLQEEMEELSKT